jgi:hypothetical protein
MSAARPPSPTSLRKLPGEVDAAWATQDLSTPARRDAAPERVAVERS